MRDHLRFSCAWWHTFCAGGNDQFGEATLAKPWEKADSVLEMCKQRVDAAFEFFTKLGIDVWVSGSPHPLVLLLPRQRYRPRALHP